MNDIPEGRWIRVGRTSDFAIGDILATTLDATEVIVCRTASGFSALERRCLHAGADLAEGLIVDETLICPLHGWRYRVATGAHVQSPENRLTSFEVRVDDDGVIFARAVARAKPLKEPK